MKKVTALIAVAFMAGMIWTTTPWIPVANADNIDFLKQTCNEQCTSCLLGTCIKDSLSLSVLGNCVTACVENFRHCYGETLCFTSVIDWCNERVENAGVLLTFFSPLAGVRDLCIEAQ